MRIAILLALGLVLGAATLALAPAASACTGDPSVCGVLKDVNCTRNTGIVRSLNECWDLYGPPNP